MVTGSFDVGTTSARGVQPAADAPHSSVTEIDRKTGPAARSGVTPDLRLGALEGFGFSV